MYFVVCGCRGKCECTVCGACGWLYVKCVNTSFFLVMDVLNQTRLKVRKKDLKKIKNHKFEPIKQFQFV